MNSKRVSVGHRFSRTGTLAVWLFLAGWSARHAPGADSPSADRIAPSAAVTWTSESLKTLRVEGSCITENCHSELESLAYRHGPVAKNNCLPCHTPIEEKHQFEKRPETQFLCRACHRPYPPEKLRHPDADDYCQLCHDPHGGRERFFLKGGSVGALCLNCHAKQVGGQPQHNPVAQGSCLACHEMHHAPDKPLLREPRDKICLQCHTALAAGIQESHSIHQPALEDCTFCHQPHAGGHGSARLKAPVLELCRLCHTDRLWYATTVKFPHKAAMEGDQCISCHDPHFSRGRRLLKAPTRDLCLNCHDRPYPLADGYVLNDVKTQLNQNRFVHGPARQGSCNPCHNPHGSDYPRLLNFDFPCSFYASFQEARYELCFRCHDRRLILEADTALTRFRNGRRNLHFLHVVRERKGRTCRACHHEHGSNNPLQVRESVPFGNWTMTITFQKNETGGSCQSACHTEYRYDRIEPAINLPTTSQPPSEGAKQEVKERPMDRPVGNADANMHQGG